MYEAFKTKESGWHHSKAEDMSKTDAFYFEKYAWEDPVASYVPEQFFVDQGDSEMYSQMVTAESTIVGGTLYRT